MSGSDGILGDSHLAKNTLPHLYRSKSALNTELHAISQVQAYAMVSNTITVNNSGVQIAYTDSGVPSQSPYITVVAIHGMLFSARALIVPSQLFSKEFKTSLPRKAYASLL